MHHHPDFNFTPGAEPLDVADPYRPNAAAVKAKFDALLRKYEGVPDDAFLEAPAGGRSRALDRRLAREKKLSKKHRGRALTTDRTRPG